MAHPGEIAAIVVVSTVALIALFLASMAVRSRIRSGNAQLSLVAGAFFVLAIKGVVVATALPTHMIGHEYLELISALFDLVVVALLALPFFR